MDELRYVITHNHKGGTGKTMLSVHLADYLAANGQHWCLLDADDQCNAIAWRTAHNWQGEEAISLSGNGTRAELIATVNPDIAFKHERVLIDTPPAASLVDELLQRIDLGERDLIVCPVNGRLSIDGAIKVAEEVAAYPCRVVLVVNHTDPKHDHAQEEINAIEELTQVEDLPVEIFRIAIPRNEKYMREAELRGVPIWAIPYARRTFTAQAIEAFCRWVADGAPPDQNDATLLGGDGPSPSAGRGTISPELKKRLWN